MRRKVFLFAVLVGSLITIGMTSKAQAQSGEAFFTTVFFDDGNHVVGGISETYATYDIAYYYDAGADGVLYYTNPTQQIDSDVGEGIDDTYYDFYFGLMYGIEVEYTTNDYRPNKIVCADTIHYFRPVYTPIPINGGGYSQWYDPYQLSAMGSFSEESQYSETVPNNPGEYYSPEGIIVRGRTYACIRTPTVASVTFQEIDSPLTTNPTGDFGNGAVFGGGKRIFADRLSPDDAVNHRTVRVRAQLAASGGSPTFTSGAKVYFRNFDVDDPTPNPTIDDNGAAGNDNREDRVVGSPYPASADGTFSQCTATSNGCYALTDSNGVATAVFEVTRQPGDNFMIAASTEDGYLNTISTSGTGLSDSSGQQLPTARARQSELLTVWIKVHLEVDSMGPVGNNVVFGRIRSKGTIGSTPTWLTVYPANLEVGRFQGGQMTAGTYRFNVLDNTANQVQVSSPNGNAFLYYNAPFDLFDDDDFNDDDQPPPVGDGTLDGDDGEDVTARAETFSLMQPTSDISRNLYAAAYIEPDYTWAENQPGMNDSDVQFEIVQYTPLDFLNERRVADARRDSAGMENDEFWIGYILVGYEATEGDVDPVTDGALGGVSPPVNRLTAWTDDVTDSRNVTRGSISSIIYIESMRDEDVTDGGDFKIRTAPHELGHQFGLAGDEPGFGVMSVEDPLQFVPRHINIMRWRQASPGER